MNYRRGHIALYLGVMAFMVFFLQCGHNAEQTDAFPSRNEDLKKALLRKNKELVSGEKQQIEKYIERRGLHMQSIPNGIYYQIIVRESQDSIRWGQLVKVFYEISLLNGEVIYSSKINGPKTFQVGKDYVESGIHQVVTHMCIGDSAIVILPKHLAFGLTGDYNKIPPNTTVVYHMRLQRPS